MGDETVANMSGDVYKLSIRDGGDDLLLRIVLDGGKIAGLLVTAPFL